MTDGQAGWLAESRRASGQAGRQAGRQASRTFNCRSFLLLLFYCHTTRMHVGVPFEWPTVQTNGRARLAQWLLNWIGR